MTVSQSLSFVREFRIALGGLEQSVNIVLCPPYTALYTLSRALSNTSIDVGAQN